MPVIITIGTMLCCNTVMSQNNVQEVKDEERVQIIDIREEPPQEENTEEIFLVVEEPATFQGKEVHSFRDWVEKNLQIPESADSISGRVIIQFCVDTLGQVCDVKVLRNFVDILDLEAVRVIKSSPLWKPAKQNGRLVKQQFAIPVSFKGK